MSETAPTAAAQKPLQPSDCLTGFERHEMREPYQRFNGQPRYTLSQQDFNTYLDQIGIDSLCLPHRLGQPFLNADWKSRDGSAQSGHMLSIGFQELYEGAGWSRAALVFASYDFSTGSEYDHFATREDLAGLRSGALPGAFFANNAPGLTRFHAGLSMGLQPLWKTYVFPSEDDYVAVVFRLGDFQPEEIETVIQEFEARNPAANSSQTLDLIEQMAASIHFK